MKNIPFLIFIVVFIISCSKDKKNKIAEEWSNTTITYLNKESINFKNRTRLKEAHAIELNKIIHQLPQTLVSLEFS